MLPHEALAATPRNSLEFPSHSGGFGLTVPAQRNGDISKAPAPPDPYAVSAAQTQSNKDTAGYEASLNRVNQVTPLGSSTWNGTGPGATQTVTLNPLAQQDLDNQLKQDVNLSGLGDNLTTQAGNSLQGKIDTSASAIERWPRPLRRRPNKASTIPALPNVSSDFAAQTKQAQDAVYNQATSRLDPQWQNNQHDLDSRLANQGVVQGRKPITAPKMNSRATRTTPIIRRTTRRRRRQRSFRTSFTVSRSPVVSRRSGKPIPKAVRE
jgi:hypothetical protein